MYAPVGVWLSKPPCSRVVVPGSEIILPALPILILPAKAEWAVAVWLVLVQAEELVAEGIVLIGVDNL